MGVYDGKLSCAEGVERAEDAELARVVGGGVTEGGHLHGHKKETGISCDGTGV